MKAGLVMKATTVHEGLPERVGQAGPAPISPFPHIFTDRPWASTRTPQPCFLSSHLGLGPLPSLTDIGNPSLRSARNSLLLREFAELPSSWPLRVLGRLRRGALTPLLISEFHGFRARVPQVPGRMSSVETG